MKPVVFVLPSQDFDPSEAAVPWKLLTEAGQPVRFATPDGGPSVADPIMVTGVGLDWWGWIPGVKHLKLIGLTLRANGAARRAYRAMVEDRHFQNPLSHGELRPSDFDGVVFPGGHAKTMRPYLESDLLQNWVLECLATGDGDRNHLPIAAICHGVLVLARAKRPDGTSAIHNRQVTALTWAFERKAWLLNRIFRFWDPHYYRTYLEEPGDPPGYWSVEHEIKRLLDSPEQFLDVPPSDPEHWRKTNGLHRDTVDDDRPAWVVRDGNLITARWPGDVHRFARELLEAVHAFRQVSTEEAKREA